jgi:drug/metabolite transporter (DMT)-like permease
MNALALAALLAIAAATAHAAAAVVQERLATRMGQGTATAPPSRRLMSGTVLVQRAWWVAVGLAIGASLLHVAALGHGPLNLVQPIGAMTVVLALPMRAVVTGRRVNPAEWHGAGLAVLGLAGLLLLSASGRPVRTLTGGEVLGVSATAGAVVALALVMATITSAMVARSMIYAAGAGVAFGAASAITQTVVVRAANEGPWSIVGQPAVIVLVLAGGGLLLAQAAYRGGLGAPLAMLALVNPATAVVIGMSLLGERYAGGPAGLALAVAAALVAAAGVLRLARAGDIGQHAWAPATLGVR